MNYGYTAEQNTTNVGLLDNFVNSTSLIRILARFRLPPSSHGILWWQYCNSIMGIWPTLCNERDNFSTLHL